MAASASLKNSLVPMVFRRMGEANLFVLFAQMQNCSSHPLQSPIPPADLHPVASKAKALVLHQGLQQFSQGQVFSFACQDGSWPGVPCHCCRFFHRLKQQRMQDDPVDTESFNVRQALCQLEAAIGCVAHVEDLGAKRVEQGDGIHFLFYPKSTMPFGMATLSHDCSTSL